ncbi:hypothetical protein ACB098_04G095900 [Castanea mollissima]
MGLSTSLFMLMHFLALLSLYNLMFASSSFVQPLCHDDESFALLQFKESFIIDQSASFETSAYPKVSSRKLESDDCCSWDGVGCDKDTGHVISLNLSSSCLYGSINSSSSLFRPVNLQRLYLADNDFNLSRIPVGIRQLSNLTYLDLYASDFAGQIPAEIFQLTGLIYPSLSHNNFTGPVPSSFGNLTELIHLDLSMNNFPGPVPSSFGNLTELIYLDLSYNNFAGPVPSSFGNLTKLINLDLSYNNFNRGALDRIGFHQLPVILPWTNLENLDLSKNKLQGSLPIPPPSIGWIPRSLVNCTMLETLVLGNNQINDSFPSWLGVLPELGVLILRHNQLQGAIGKPEGNFVFPNLHIVDFSYNNFTGKLPFEYFQLWKAMQIIDKHGQLYMQETMGFNVPGYTLKSLYTYSMTFTNKGRELAYERIPYIFIAMDLSSNKFEGEIPELMGNLQAIQLLNFSNNLLTGSIPSSLEKLTALEALDLSQNKLSGEIPPQLTQLTFLAFFNVSNNHLVGPIPHGNQFDTFQDKSFGGNPGLCGNPLPKKCGNSKGSLLPPLTFEEINQDSKLLFEFVWKVVVIGYGCGFIIGVIIGQIVIARKYKWFIYLHFAFQHQIGR